MFGAPGTFENRHLQLAHFAGNNVNALRPVLSPSAHSCMDISMYIKLTGLYITTYQSKCRGGQASEQHIARE